MKAFVVRVSTYRVMTCWEYVFRINFPSQPVFIVGAEPGSCPRWSYTAPLPVSVPPPCLCTRRVVTQLLGQFNRFFLKPSWNRYFVYNIWSWTRLKPGAWSSHHVCHMGGRDPSVKAITCCFPVCTQTGSRDGIQTLGWGAGLSQEEVLNAIPNFHPLVGTSCCADPRMNKSSVCTGRGRS